MAHSLSSEKRIRQNETRRLRNQSRKSKLKGQVGKFLEAVHDQKVDVAEKSLRETVKLLDQTAAKGTIHANTAARKKSRLAKKLNRLKAGGAAAKTG